MSLFSRTDRSAFGQWWWTVDRAMMAGFFGLAICGIVLVATASPPVAERIGAPYYHFLIRHVIVLVPTLFMLVGLSMLNRKFVRRVATLVFFGSLLAMVSVLFVGEEIKGATRWIHLGGFSLQPSEFVKPAFAIMSAWMMALQKKNQRFQGIVVATGFYFVTVALLLLQPDFGMTFLVTGIWVAQICLAGIPFRLLALLSVLIVGGVFGAYYTFGHVQSRIDRYLDPASGDNYQIEKSLEAFQNGGFIGTGLGQGTVKMSLPDGHADFIFSVAGEEMGLVFAWMIIGTYCFILLRGYQRLMDTDDMFVVLAVGGLLSGFGLQAMVHMGSSLNLFPAKGMTLPFISYGGSSLLSMGYAMGMLLALTRRRARSGIARAGLSSRPSVHPPSVPERTQGEVV